MHLVAVGKFQGGAVVQPADFGGLASGMDGAGELDVFAQGGGQVGRAAGKIGAWRRKDGHS